MSTSEAHPLHVFDWLDRVRARPGMYVGDATAVRDLESLVHGYYSALHVHGLVEPVPSMDRHFSTWLRIRRKWSLSCGWGLAIEEHSKPGQALINFFRLTDQYRRLAPVSVASARLGARHRPTGKRCRIGVDGRIARPTKIDVIQYQPEPIHFLRFHYGRRIEDQPTLFENGCDKTSLNDAKTWVQDEFRVNASEWITAASAPAPRRTRRGPD